MYDLIIQEIANINDEINLEIALETPLIGGESALNSMGLVRLCLYLEELAEEQGFDFDWTSEAAMSKSRSMFRSVRSLIEEFERQKSA